MEMSTTGPTNPGNGWHPDQSTVLSKNAGSDSNVGTGQRSAFLPLRACRRSSFHTHRRSLSGKAWPDPTGLVCQNAPSPSIHEW